MRAAIISQASGFKARATPSSSARIIIIAGIANINTAPSASCAIAPYHIPIRYSTASMRINKVRRKYRLNRSRSTRFPVLNRDRWRSSAAPRTRT